MVELGLSEEPPPPVDDRRTAGPHIFPAAGTGSCAFAYDNVAAAEARLYHEE